MPGGNNNPGQGSTVTVTQTVTSTRVSTTTQYERETVTETETVTSTEPCNTGGPDPTECPHDRKFELFGVNEAGAEFSPDVLPGVDGEDYTWPTLDSIVHFLEKGFNTVRIPVSLERYVAFPNRLCGGLAVLIDLFFSVSPQKVSPTQIPTTNNTSLVFTALSATLSTLAARLVRIFFLHALVSRANVLTVNLVIDIHNFGRYNGEPLGEADVENFGNFWAALASWTSFNPNVGFNLMTKWHDQPGMAPNLSMFYSLRNEF